MRTSEAAVKKVLLGDYDDVDNPSLLPFIEVGSAMVDDLVDYATDSETTVPGSTRLELIERWLAAWAYKMSDQQAQSASNEASMSYKGQSGMGLDINNYGQTAKRLDPTGYLVSIDSGGDNEATVDWGGLPPSEQTDYVDRD